jgi:hypothetical protein
MSDSAATAPVLLIGDDRLFPVQVLDLLFLLFGQPTLVGFLLLLLEKLG